MAVEGNSQDRICGTLSYEQFPCARLMDQREDDGIENADSPLQIDRHVQRVFHFHTEDISRCNFYLSLAINPPVNLRRAITILGAILYFSHGFSKRRTAWLCFSDKYYPCRIFHSTNATDFSREKRNTGAYFYLVTRRSRNGIP